MNYDGCIIKFENLLCYIGIPKLIDYGRLDATKFFLVITLHGADSSTMKFQYYDILNMGQTIIKTLRTIHMLGYVHCDLKPYNILHEEKNGKEKEYTLIDFGICRKYLDTEKNHIQKHKLHNF